MAAIDHTADETTPHAIRVRNVSLTYPARRREQPIRALGDIDLTVAANEFAALLGPNGSGKTTLFKLLNTTLKPDAGTVEIFGTAEPAAIRRLIGVVLQSPALDPHLTVRENLHCQAGLYGIAKSDARERIEHGLESAGLGDRSNQRIKTLSRGLARRVDLIRALLHKPRVLLLDEPTVGLDPAARERFLHALEDRRRAGMTILMSTHLIDEAEQCDRAILLHEGKIVGDDAPSVLREEAGAQIITVRQPEKPEFPELQWTESSNGWTARIDNTETTQRLVGELTSKETGFSIAPPTLADVFSTLTGSELDSVTSTTTV